MIVIGYPGIGKTTLSAKNQKVVDLESSSFWKIYTTTENQLGTEKTRPDDWYIYYCQVAQNISSQGFTVFVSSHKEVRDWLATHNEEPVCAIYPSPDIKDDWLRRLEGRYIVSNSDKDLKAFERAKVSYEEDTTALEKECRYPNCRYDAAVIIHDMCYDLEDIVKDLDEIVKEERDKEANKEQEMDM